MIGIVPMKRNSERVPNKNFRDLCGHPLFYYVIKSLVDCGKIEKVVINTDSPEIAEQVLKHFSSRVEISMRPEAICGDFVSMNIIIDYEIQRNGADKNYIQTHTTNPFLRSQTISEAITVYEKSLKEGYDSVFSANLIKSRLYDDKMNPINHDPDNLIRTQDLPDIYDENSNFYIFSGSSFAKTKARIGKKPYIYVMNKLESVDIDNQEDWDLAQILMANKVVR